MDYLGDRRLWQEQNYQYTALAMITSFPQNGRAYPSNKTKCISSIVDSYFGEKKK